MENNITALEHIKNVEKKWRERLNNMKENRARDDGNIPDGEMFLLDQMIQNVAELIRDYRQILNVDGEKLILLKRNPVYGFSPTLFEIHRGEINQDKNLILTTKDESLATKLVVGYNTL